MKVRNGKFMVWVVMLLVLSVIATGCGSGNNKGQTANPAPTPTAAAPTASPEGNDAPKEDPWQKVVEAAEKEGRVVVNLSNGEYVRHVVDAFEKAYPAIKVEFTQLLGNDFSPRLSAERNAGQFLWDVYLGGSGTTHSNLIPMNAIDEFPRDLPESTPTAQLDELWIGGFDHGFTDEGRKYSYAISSYMVDSIMINRDVISEAELSKPEDLLDPKWTGKITWQTPDAAGAGSQAAAQVFYTQGEEYLRKLLQQKIVITDNRVQQAGWLARGSYPIAIGTSTAELDEVIKETNANVQAFAKGPAFSRESFGATAVALIKDAPNPNAARVFINWLLSKEGGQAHAELSKYNSRRTDVPVVDKATEVKLSQGEEAFNLNRQEHESLVQKARAIVKEELK